MRLDKLSIIALLVSAALAIAVLLVGLNVRAGDLERIQRDVDKTQAIVLYTLCQNNQERNTALIHVLETEIIARQIDLLYATSNGQYSFNNTQISILASEANTLREQNKGSCLGKLRSGEFGVKTNP